jgi:hypothetical protein
MKQLLVRRGDVEKAELVGARRIVARRDLDGVTGVGQIDEAHALHDATGVDVEAGNDPPGEHQRTASASPSASAPE